MQAARRGPERAAPPRFVERRVASRRAEDRIVHQETRLLAGALDELAADRSAEARLAGILGLLARVVGARRAAVLADGTRAAGGRFHRASEDESRRPGARRLARRGGPPIAVRPRRRARGRRLAGQSVTSATSTAARRAIAAGAGRRRHHYALVALPGAGGHGPRLRLRRRRRAAAALPERLPTAMARHAALVLLALGHRSSPIERELAMLRARDAERAPSSPPSPTSCGRRSPA